MSEHHGFPASWMVRLDTDAVHPQALTAAFEIAVDRLQTEADESGEAIDWGTIRLTLEPISTNPSETRMRVSAKRFL